MFSEDSLQCNTMLLGVVISPVSDCTIGPAKSTNLTGFNQPNRCCRNWWVKADQVRTCFSIFLDHHLWDLNPTFGIWLFLKFQDLYHLRKKNAPPSSESLFNLPGFAPFFSVAKAVGVFRGVTSHLKSCMIPYLEDQSSELVLHNHGDCCKSTNGLWLFLFRSGLSMVYKKGCS